MTSTQTRIQRLKRRFPSRNPNKRAAAATIVSRDLAEHIAREVLARKPQSAARWIRAAILPCLPKRSGWYRELRKLAATLGDIGKNGANAVPWFPVFNIDGNSKLPFAAFSTLPGITCPGAGACLEWCYSFRAWRYPAAFCRQLQNTALMTHCPEIIANALDALPNDIDVRLYVDGDFANESELSLWMALLTTRPDLRVYGYSKSWQTFLQYADDGGEFAPNYVLNLSSGSVFESRRWNNAQSFADRMRDLRNTAGLPVVRNWFVAVKIDSDEIERGSARYDNPEYHRRVRAAAQEQLGERAFSCPGRCGKCGTSQHMCGKLSANVLIAIGVH